MDIHGVDHPVARARQQGIERLVARADHEERGLPKGAHRGFCGGQVGGGDGVRAGGGGGDPFAAALPVADGPAAAFNGLGGGPCGLDHGVKLRGGHAGNIAFSSAMAASTRAPS